MRRDERLDSGLRRTEARSYTMKTVFTPDFIFTLL